MNLIQRQDALLRTERKALLDNFACRGATLPPTTATGRSTSLRWRITALLEPLAAGNDAPGDEDEGTALNRLKKQGRELLFAQQAWLDFRTKLELRSKEDRL